MNNKKILVVEDENDVRKLIHFNLFSENYNVILSADGESAINLANKENPDLILLDLMLPKINGIEVCKLIKKNNRTKDIPIIILTALGEEENIVDGLEAGADDYITKPYGPKILIARIKALLRRADKQMTNKNNTLKKHDISLNLEKRVCTFKENQLHLTYSEFQILNIFMRTPGRVFTRSQIVDFLRGDNHAVTDRSVDVLVVGLRKKLGINGEIIETVRGVGYRLKE